MKPKFSYIQDSRGNCMPVDFSKSREENIKLFFEKFHKETPNIMVDFMPLLQIR